MRSRDIDADTGSVTINNVYLCSKIPADYRCCASAWRRWRRILLDPASSTQIDLPADSPLTLISTSMDNRGRSSRGGAIVLDLHMSLTLRNSGSRRVRGVTLLITAQEFAPGGKGSVARPCIDVPPSQNFTVPVDIRLVRPVHADRGPLVRVQLDGVLFDDLSFFGPNKLNSQRAMTFWETGSPARPRLFQAGPAGEGRSGLQKEIQASWPARPSGRSSMSRSRAAGAPWFRRWPRCRPTITWRSLPF